MLDYVLNVVDGKSAIWELKATEQLDKIILVHDGKRGVGRLSYAKIWLVELEYHALKLLPAVVFRIPDEISVLDIVLPEVVAPDKVVRNRASTRSPVADPRHELGDKIREGHQMLRRLMVKIVHEKQPFLRNSFQIITIAVVRQDTIAHEMTCFRSDVIYIFIGIAFQYLIIGN